MSGLSQKPKSPDPMIRCRFYLKSNFYICAFNANDNENEALDILSFSLLRERFNGRFFSPFELHDSNRGVKVFHSNQILPAIKTGEAKFSHSSLPYGWLCRGLCTIFLRLIPYCVDEIKVYTLTEHQQKIPKLWL